jgi:hypothetical protein
MVGMDEAIAMGILQQRQPAGAYDRMDRMGGRLRS